MRNIVYFLKFFSSLVSLLIILNATSCIFIFNHDPNYGYKIMKKKWNLISNQKEPVDWLILGDSSCNQGFDTDTALYKHGYTTLNLCTVGGGLLIDDGILLKEYYEKVGPPKQGVILIHVYDIWERSGGEAQIRSLYPFGGTNVSKSLLTDIKANLLRIFVLYSKNKSILSLLANGLNDTKFEFTQNGTMKMEKSQIETDTEQDSVEHINRLLENQTHINTSNLHDLNAIVSFVSDSKKDIHLFMSPMYNRTFEHTFFKHHYQKITQGINSFVQSRNLNIRLHLEPMLFDKNELEGIDHLLYGASKKYTHWIFENIKTGELT